MRKYHNKTLFKQHLISQQLRINNYLKNAKNKSIAVNKLHQDKLIEEHVEEKDNILEEEHVEEKDNILEEEHVEEKDNILEEEQRDDLYKKNIIVKGNTLIKGNVL